MTTLANRFRKFLPVIVDVETGGLNPAKSALLELAAVTLKMDEEGQLALDQTHHYHVLPFEGAHLDPACLAFNKIDPYHPFRFAMPENEVLTSLFKAIKKECKQKKCTRAVVVGHNAWFDLHFLNAASQRCQQKSVFHQFTSLDTATLGALAFGQTVLSKALAAAGIEFNTEEAHSALYDAEQTAKLFCHIVNLWKFEFKNNLD